MKSIGGVRPCDGSGTRHTGPIWPIYIAEEGARHPTCNPGRRGSQPRRLSVSRGWELSCITRSGAGRECRRAQAPPAGPAKRQERRPILPGQTCCALQYSADGASKHRPLLSSAVIGSMATQIHHSWRGACGCTLRLLRRMVPIFRSCLIEDDLMALTPHADGLFQFSISVREFKSSCGFSG